MVDVDWSAVRTADDRDPLQSVSLFAGLPFSRERKRASSVAETSSGRASAWIFLVGGWARIGAEFRGMRRDGSLEALTLLPSIQRAGQNGDW